MSKRMRVYREGVFDYSIVWENNFEGLSGEIKSLQTAGGRICVVTDSRVARLYQESVCAQLEHAGFSVDVFVFPEGEASKNLSTVQELYRFLIEHHYTRKDLLAALGGGVTGDLTGFAAATYLRGIDFIQIPTTLLAQVDSSVGGKTGVDFDQYKNMVGAFHQPRLVYMNMEVLKTLDNAQFASGMGEVLKTALIRDGAFYEWIINHMEPIMERSGAVLAKMIRKCCEIKSSVVESDPTEQGERAILNLGHTVGHAIEKLKDFQLLHGQCVALGTVAAAYISFKRGYLSLEEFYEIRDMNVGFDLPIFFDGLAAEDILKATKSDKKMANGQIRFILLKKIGQAVIDRTVTDEEIIEAVNFINGDLIDGE
ncbi:MAG TPA: 3-dehydroquinate synthase [Candidatus Pullilachnospira intestinigallinarum]|nr:3-dehydroquinate synthase [Candidatus Pullilachnospira intestinigallinarum]